MPKIYAANAETKSIVAHSFLGSLTLVVMNNSNLRQKSLPIQPKFSANWGQVQSRALLNTKDSGLKFGLESV